MIKSNKVKNVTEELTKGFKNVTEVMGTKEIFIKYHSTEIDDIMSIEKGDWIDLRSAEDVTLKSGEFKLISLGISMKLPKGHEAHLAPRSSTFKNFGIIQANSVGVIDETFCGEDDIWRFPAIALRDTEIKKNERICQFRIIEKMCNIEFTSVDKLDGANRGGFGSTGTK